MAVFLNIYIFIYTITLCSIYYLINLSTNINLNNSLEYTMYSIITFNKFKSILLTLLLSLSGLPPFFLFFIKFNYLTYILFSLNPFISFLIFIMFFLNMLYYIQIFFFKNELFTITTQKLIKNKPNYSVIFYIYFFLFFLIFSLFFLVDFIYIYILL